MPSSTTIQLPAGTNVEKAINLPTPGSWLGGVDVSLGVTGADATIHAWILVHPDRTSGTGNRYYRRIPAVGGPYTTGSKEWTLSQDTRVWNGTYQGENLCIVYYTSTNDISFGIETTRAYNPPPYPFITGTDIYPEHGKFFHQSTAPLTTP